MAMTRAEALRTLAQAGNLPPQFQAEYDELQRSTSPTPFDADKFAFSKDPLSGIEKAIGAVRSVAQGSSFGFADELERLAARGGALAAGIVSGAENPMQLAREVGREFDPMQAQQMARFAQQEPTANIVGQLAGGIMSPGGAASARYMGAAPSVGAGIGRGAIMGGLTGAAYGAGTAEGGIGDRASGLTGGAALGSALGGALPAFAALPAATLSAQHALARNPNATLGQVIGDVTGLNANPVRYAEKMLSQSILGEPLRAAERRQIGYVAQELKDMTPRAAVEAGEFGAQLQGAARNALEKNAQRMNSAYEKSVFSKLPGERLAPATATNTIAELDDLALGLPPAQRGFIDQVRSELADPQGLNIAKLNRIKQVLGSKTVSERGGVDSPTMQRLYDALKRDYYASVEASGGKEAVDALARADRAFADYAKSGTKRTLTDMADAGPLGLSALAQKAIAQTEGKRSNVAFFNTLQKSLSPEDFDAVRQSIIRRLADEPADNFNRIYNRMSPQIRETVFGSKRPKIEELANIMQQVNLKSLNPSGTAAGNLTTGTLGGGILAHDPVTAAMLAGGTYGLSAALARPTLPVNVAARLSRPFVSPLQTVTPQAGIIGGQTGGSLLNFIGE